MSGMNSVVSTHPAALVAAGALALVTAVLCGVRLVQVRRHRQAVALAQGAGAEREFAGLPGDDRWYTQALRGVLGYTGGYPLAYVPLAELDATVVDLLERAARWRAAQRLVGITGYIGMCVLIPVAITKAPAFPLWPALLVAVCAVVAVIAKLVADSLTARAQQVDDAHLM